PSAGRPSLCALPCFFYPTICFCVRDDPQVLWVFYEDLLADPARHIEVIAEFIGVPLDDELRAIVLEQASFQFMKDHQELFDDHLIFDKCKVNMGLSPDTKVRASKVNKGEKGDRSGLTQEILETLNDRWNAVITAETGLASYQDLRNELSVLRR
ncbi:Sult1c2a, partial [Symbiodinium microadriaticum]